MTSQIAVFERELSASKQTRLLGHFQAENCSFRKFRIAFHVWISVSLYLTLAYQAIAETPMEMKAESFPISSVKLLDGPFKQAIEVDKAYLLRLEPDRLLAGFRQEAGLPKKAEPYRGWEAIGPGRRYTMAGHTLGHYLSAAAR